MVITGRVIALILFAIISLVVMYFLGKKLFKFIKGVQSTAQ